MMSDTAKLRIWTHARLATCDGERPGYGLIEDGAIAARGDQIVWLGQTCDLPTALAKDAIETRDLQGRLITPGLIDCHTHLVFGGDRSQEWRLKLSGAPYEEIARAGGGIASTVAATRAASEADLTRSALTRLDSLLADGATTVEIKSGYGLSLEDELKMLRVARGLATERKVRVRTTLLAAHTLPPEYRADRAAYVRKIIEEIIPASVGLADAVDAFCETIAFTPEETRAIFEAAKAHDLPVKLHADQLTDSGGASLAAGFGALSADHLEHASPDGLAAMTAAGTVAVLLPGAYYVLREPVKPPVEVMRRLGLPMAVASDCNPGTSPMASLRMAMHLAVTLFGLTPEEALAGTTRHAARALGLGDRLGELKPGTQCDLALWDTDQPDAVTYWLGRLPECRRVVDGATV
jgi:imidazolonepropionase